MPVVRYYHRMNVIRPGINESDERWMRQALWLADEAAQQGEVPVGAVLVENNQLVGQGFNQSIGLNDCSAHAEIMALRSAGTNQQNYRFPGATLYCTLEPCAMCAGALVHARIERLVFAADDPKAGAAGSVVNLLEHPHLNHCVVISNGLLEQEARVRLKRFFMAKR